MYLACDRCFTIEDTVGKVEWTGKCMYTQYSYTYIIELQEQECSSYDDCIKSQYTNI